MIAESGVTCDSNGNATRVIRNLPTYSWLGNAYRVGSVDQISALQLFLATSWWAHEEGALGFQSDVGKEKAGRANDKLVDTNCRRLIKDLK